MVLEFLERRGDCREREEVGRGLAGARCYNFWVTARTHDVFAFATLITVGTYLAPSVNLATMIVAFIGSEVGSLLPDIDQASNRLWDLIPAGNLLGRLLKNIFLAHRTLSHSVLGVVLFYKLFEWVLPKFLNPSFIDIRMVTLAVMLGIVSHIFIDGFTEEGLPLFFPLKVKVGFPPVASWRIKTGKGFEKFVVFPAVLAYLVWFLSSNYGKIYEILRLTVK